MRFARANIFYLVLRTLKMKNFHKTFHSLFEPPKGKILKNAIRIDIGFILSFLFFYRVTILHGFLSLLAGIWMIQSYSVFGFIFQK